MGKRAGTQTKKQSTHTSIIKRFIRERGLGDAVGRYQRLPSRRTVVTTVVTRFEEGIQEQKLYVTHEKNRTVFRDFVTLLRLGSSPKPTKKALQDLFASPKPIHETRIVSDILRTEFSPDNYEKSLIEKYTYAKSPRAITLRYQERNSSLVRSNTVLRTHTRTNIPPHKYGFVAVRVTYIAEDKTRKTLVVRSVGGLQLDLTADVERGIFSAIRNGFKAGEVNFSPVDIIIHDVWYEYYSDRPHIQVRPQFRYPRGSSRLLTSSTPRIFAG